MTYDELYKISKDKYKIEDNVINYLFKYYLNINKDSVVNSYILNDYFNKLEEVNKGIPLQYIVGNVDFYGYNFMVNKNVLIPRFETEEVVNYAYEYINKYFNKASLLDIGTGSGIIGITLKKLIPNIDVTMIDISDDALEVSLINANNLNVLVDIYKSDMLKEVLKKDKKYDVIISNPPYIREDEEVMDIVKNNEPNIALYGGIDGLRYYKEILKNAKNIIKDKALIIFEIGEKQALDIINISKYYFNDSSYIIKQDLQGRDRIFILLYNLND